jgi:hypothetical protein
MENRTIMALGILALTVSGVGLTVGYSLWSISHVTTGHVTVNAPPEPTPTGDFTVPVDITFPTIEPGQSTTQTVTVQSTLSQDVTLTATGGAGAVTVTAPATTLPAGGSVTITLTLTADVATAPDNYTLPIQFTVTE